MTRISIINIGNELLSGERIDTNSVWLSRKLVENGLEVAYKFTAGDDTADILDCLELAAKKSEIILLTGGLGPTDDDLTRQSIAKFLGVELEFNEALFNEMASYFDRRKVTMSNKNRIQAYLPAGAEALKNSCGTAAGIKAVREQRLIYAMPGVPSEMKVMFEAYILPDLEKLTEAGKTVCKKLKCVGIGESTLAEKIGDMMIRGRNPLINCTVSNSIITLYIIAKAGSEQLARDMISSTESRLRQMIGEYIYGEDEQTLEEVLANLLLSRGATVATAESCTGGLIAKTLTDVPGSSGFFGYGWVTYSNEAKISQLGVSPEAIKKFGAVSREVVEQMARGAIKQSGSDYAIAVSGIAGPTGGTEEKPVGTVYIAAADKNKCIVKKRNYPNSREAFKIRTTAASMNILRRNFLLN